MAHYNRGDGEATRRRSLAPQIRIGMMAIAACLFFFLVVVPLTNTDSLSAKTSDQLLTADEAGGHAARLRHARTPFDIVYLWVNGSEPVYAANRAKFGGLKRAGDRDRDNGELRYSLRSLDMYMPWFTGTIHFVHQNLPCWLDTDHPRLNLVHHRQIFTDQENTLPTFSSDAIEAHLHRIPGLQKHFILMNDDFFLGRATSLTDYVLSNGDPILYFEKYPVMGTKEDHLEYMKKGKKSWLSKIYHTKSLLVDHFGITNPERYHFLKHAPTVLDRDILAKLWEVFPDAIRKSIHYRHRKPDGVSMDFLHHHWCMFDPQSSCYALPQSLSDKEAKFVKAGSTDSKELIDTLATFEEAESRFFGVSPPKFFSINDEADVGKGRNVEGVQYAYETFLPARFPTPSQWEKDLY